jgi:small conductance mechanosensitive channel
MFTSVDLQLFFNSPIGKIILVSLILIGTHLLAKLTKTLVQNQLLHPRFFDVTKTQRVIIRHFLTALIYIIGIGFAIYVIPSLRTLSVSLFAGAGVIAVIAGFASQQAFSNVVSGLFIALFTPFRVGDIIKTSDTVMGIVEDINLRHTTLKTFENRRIIIPNNVINSEVITNYNIDDEKICRFVEIGVSYDSDLDLAMQIMREEAAKHPNCIDIRSEDEKQNGIEKVKVKTLKFADSAIILRAWVWANDPMKAFFMECDLNKTIKDRFDKEGVEIPFPYRTLVMKSDLEKPKKKKSTVKKKTGKKK